MGKKIILGLMIAGILLLLILYQQRKWEQTQDIKEKEAVTSTTTVPPSPITNSIGMEFAYIPPGSFMMGSPAEEPGRYDREARHPVELTHGFYMQITEVTQAQWETVMQVSSPSYFQNCGPDCPVEQVSWNDVQEFIWKLNQMERSRAYSLPTEAEWEYACRAGSETRFHWGDDADCNKANYGVAFVHNECTSVNPGRTMKVASFPPNAWGLYDMHGNVWEWCMDRFDLYPVKGATDPVGAYATVDRIYRGGSWSVNSRYCRSANRDGDVPNARLSSLGFRIVRKP